MSLQSSQKYLGVARTMHGYELENFQIWQEWSEKMLPVYLSKNLLVPLPDNIPSATRNREMRNSIKVASFPTTSHIKCKKNNEQIYRVFLFNYPFSTRSQGRILKNIDVGFVANCRYRKTGFFHI